MLVASAGVLWRVIDIKGVVVGMLGSCGSGTGGREESRD